MTASAMLTTLAMLVACTPLATAPAVSGQEPDPTCEEVADVPAVVRLVGAELFVSSGRRTEQDLLSCSLTTRTVGLPSFVRLYVRRDPDGQGEFATLRKRYEGRLRIVYDLGEKAFYFYQDMAFPDRVGSSAGRPSREWGLAAHGGAITVVVSGVPERGGAREEDAKAYLAARAKVLLDAYWTVPLR